MGCLGIIGVDKKQRTVKMHNMTVINTKTLLYRSNHFCYKSLGKTICSVLSLFVVTGIFFASIFYQPFLRF